jgi:hypothetical protein
MEDVMASDTDRPISPAIKLFDSSPKEDPSKHLAGGEPQE